MSSSTAQHVGTAAPLKRAWIAFPGRVAAYTHGAALQAARSVLDASTGWEVIDGLAVVGGQESESGSGSIAVPSPSTTSLYLADYDLLPFDELLSPSSSSSSSPSQCSSYVIRKAIIRKHHLATILHAHSAKLSSSSDEAVRRRGASVRKATPRTWCIDVQFADELDELSTDDLYDLREELEANEAIQVGGGATGSEGKRKKWFILKPGMADRGNGIRLFSTADELREIFEGFEDDSEEEEEDDEEQEDGARSGQAEDEEGSTGIMTSQLRHFVIQDYISRPLLISPPRLLSTSADVNPRPAHFRKFHIRAYVLCVGSMSVYLCDDMLALFAPEAYVDPDSLGLEELGLGEDKGAGEAEGRGGGGGAGGGEDQDHTMRKRDWKRSALTNTCLHDASKAGEEEEGGTREAEENVHLLSDLVDSPYLPSTPQGQNVPTPPKLLTASQLLEIRTSAANVIGMAFESAAKAGSVHFQTWPHAFEIFGVDLLVGWDEPEVVDQHGAKKQEDGLNVWLLEVNAQPDFAQSGPKLHKIVVNLFRRSIELAVLRPLLARSSQAERSKMEGSGEKAGVETATQEKEEEGEEGVKAKKDERWEVGQSRDGMTLCFDERLSGAW